MTEGPSAADEPVPFDSVFHTVTDYSLVRDTGPRIENEITAELTEADFAAGLPDPELTVIEVAFTQARELDPTAVLVLNEYDIGFAGPKFDGLLSLLDRLDDRNVPKDAVGFQLHVFSSFTQFNELTTNMTAIAERGFDIHVTELDVAIVNDDSEQTQADVYRGIINICLAQPRCKGITELGLH